MMKTLVGLAFTAIWAFAGNAVAQSVWVQVEAKRSLIEAQERIRDYSARCSSSTDSRCDQAGTPSRWDRSIQATPKRACCNCAIPGAFRATVSLPMAAISGSSSGRWGPRRWRRR